MRKTVMFSILFVLVIPSAFGVLVNTGQSSFRVQCAVQNEQATAFQAGCCTWLVRNEQGVCVRQPTCGAAGERAVRGKCCEGLQLNRMTLMCNSPQASFVRRCAGEGMPASMSCCQGLTAISGVCGRPRTCSEEGRRPLLRKCCEGLRPWRNVCMRPEVIEATCGAEGERMSLHGKCCEGLVSRFGLCKNIQVS